MIKHVNITVYGKVQKVGFRWEAIEKALELNLKGFVENLDDGNVYIEIEGEIPMLKKFLAWAHRGPQNANVEKVDYESVEDLKNFEDFRNAFETTYT